MANAVYPKFKAAALSASIANIATDLIAGSVKLIMIAGSLYTYSATHEFLSDIPAGARISISGALSGKAVSTGAAFSSANGLFTTVSGVQVTALIMFIDTSVAGTSRLVFFQDTGVTGLPVTPSGASYNAIMDAAGWFVL